MNWQTPKRILKQTWHASDKRKPGLVKVGGCGGSALDCYSVPSYDLKDLASTPSQRQGT